MVKIEKAEIIIDGIKQTIENNTANFLCSSYPAIFNLA